MKYFTLVLNENKQNQKQGNTKYDDTRVSFAQGNTHRFLRTMGMERPTQTAQISIEPNKQKQTTNKIQQRSERLDARLEKEKPMKTVALSISLVALSMNLVACSSAPITYPPYAYNGALSELHRSGNPSTRPAIPASSGDLRTPERYVQRVCVSTPIFDTYGRFVRYHVECR